jgi:hypothetical protein
MKIWRVMLLGALAVGCAGGLEAMAGSPIALPSGNFSFAAEGTEATCATGSCPVINIIEIGSSVRDKSGNACGTHTAVVNTVPPAGTPTVASITHVMQVINYDPSTGTGDLSLTEYFGGSCNGAAFNSSSGGTQVVTGTLHFVVSNGGNRIDSIVTLLHVAGGAGGYSLKFKEMRQDNSANAQ